METKRENPDKITLGSGKIYILEYSGTMPEIDAFCKEENLLGKIKGGAQLTYTTETHDEQDDLGTTSKVIITKEAATLKLGLITFNGQTIAKLNDRCKVTEDKTKGRRTLHIGGAGNSQGKQWAYCFHHHDKEDGDAWVRVRGANQAGLALAYAMDAGSKLEPEIKALPSDAEGTLIIYDEEISTSAAAGE